MSSLGSIYDINLTSGEIRIIDFTAEMAREYLGGFGFNITTLYNEVPKGTPLNQLHREVDPAGGVDSKLVNRHDVGMLELAYNLGFLDETG